MAMTPETKIKCYEAVQNRPNSITAQAFGVWEDFMANRCDRAETIQALESIINKSLEPK